MSSRNPVKSNSAMMTMYCPKGDGPQQGSYCSVCGAKLIAKVSGLVQFEMYTVAYGGVCPDCGHYLKHDLAHENHTYCPACGRELYWTCRHRQP